MRLPTSSATTTTITTTIINIINIIVMFVSMYSCVSVCVYLKQQSTHPVLTNGESTDVSIETDKYSVIGGGSGIGSSSSSRTHDAATDGDAARQISGSSSLRTSGNNKQTRRRKNNNSHSSTTTTRKPNFDAIDDDYDVDEYSHGILITEPHPIPPPFDPSFRVIGGVRVPGIESEIYGSRKHGERHDVDDSWKTWDRFDSKTHGEHGQRVGTNYASVMHPEGDFMQMPSNDDTDTDDRQDDQPCTLGCLNSEFLCGHSCQCVPKFTRCNGELNCEFGEDEEECGGKLCHIYFIAKLTFNWNKLRKFHWALCSINWKVSELVKFSILILNSEIFCGLKVSI